MGSLTKTVSASIHCGFLAARPDWIDRLIDLAWAMGPAAARLRALGLEPWIEPRGGMFLWCRLPEGIDSAEVARRALAENVVLAPGNAFSLSRSAGGFLRFNVAQCADPRIFQVLEGAMRAVAVQRR